MRDNYLLAQRDRCICRHYWGLLSSGMPRMRAYASTAAAYYLSESRVRSIVQHGSRHYRERGLR